MIGDLIGYSSSLKMAQKLVTYIADPKQVQIAVAREFRDTPTLSAIRKLRAEHLAQVAKAKRGITARGIDGGMGNDDAAMRIGSDRLRDAIWRARGVLV